MAVGCGSSSSGSSSDATNGGNDSGSNATAFAGIKGKAVAVDGSPVDSATVTVGTTSVQTGADGAYELAVGAGEHALAFAKDGFATTRQLVAVEATGTTFVNSRLKARGVRGMVDASAGGMVIDASGAQLMFPAGAFVDAAGSPFAGTAVVDLTWFNPETDDLLASPVPLDTATMDGSPVILESFGMVSVDLADASGNPLKVAEGQTAEVVFPVPAGLTQPPATIPLWHGETTTWTHEGDATYDADAKVYRAQVDRFSSWNIDKVAASTCIRGIVTDAAGVGVPGAFVFARGLDYSGSSDATTEDDGRCCVVVRKSSKVEVTAFGYDGGGHVREVESGEKDTPIPPPSEDPAQVEDICLDVGAWSVSGEIPQTVTPGDNSAACAALGSYDPCLDGLIAIYACWTPSGACSISSDFMSIDWENGSSLGGSAMKGPGGVLCGNISADETASGLSNPQGQSWTFNESDDESTTTITCPNGTDVVMTAAQSAAAGVCFAPAFDTSDCTSPVGPEPGTCSSQADCTDDNVCCEFTPDVSACVPAALCGT
ncbi:MAG: hypothetical protein ACI9OJ_004691 [Myxococcota bacterium]|jgi:hypothetical protein